MKQASDNKTLELLPRGRGRPSTGDAMTPAQRQAERRARLKAEGLLPLTVNLPCELHVALAKYMQFKDITKDDVLERAVRAFIRKR